MISRAKFQREFFASFQFVGGLTSALFVSQGDVIPFEN